MVTHSLICKGSDEYRSPECSLRRGAPRAETFRPKRSATLQEQVAAKMMRAPGHRPDAQLNTWGNLLRAAAHGCIAAIKHQVTARQGG